jgi:membrane protein required for colicin V production
MNWLDAVIILALAVATFLGFRTGVIKAALSLAGLIVGIILAGRYYVPLSEHLSIIPSDSAARVAAFIIILIAVGLLAALLAQLLKWVTSAIMLGWVDRLGGAIFGLLMGALFYSVLLAVWVNFLGMSGPIVESSLANILLSRFPIVLALLPDEFDAIRSFFY